MRCCAWSRRAEAFPRESGRAGDFPGAVHVGKLDLGLSHRLREALRDFASKMWRFCPQDPCAEVEGACAPWEPHLGTPPERLSEGLAGGVSGSLAGPVEDQRVGGGAQSGLGTDRDHVEGTPRSRCVF